MFIKRQSERQNGQQLLPLQVRAGCQASSEVEWSSYHEKRCPPLWAFCGLLKIGLDRENIWLGSGHPNFPAFFLTESISYDSLYVVKHQIDWLSYQGLGGGGGGGVDDNEDDEEAARREQLELESVVGGVGACPPEGNSMMASKNNVVERRSSSAKWLSLVNISNETTNLKGEVIRSSEREVSMLFQWNHKADCITNLSGKFWLTLLFWCQLLRFVGRPPAMCLFLSVICVCVCVCVNQLCQMWHIWHMYVCV